MKSFHDFFYESNIHPHTPIEVVDSKTGEVVWSGTYDKRNVARKVIDRRDNEYGGYRFKINYPKGLDYSPPIMEYRHNLADGTPTPSIQAHNGKNPNNINKKKLHTVGDYQHKDKKLHQPGTILIGGELLSVLSDYGLEFKNGETSQIKNSPHAIQMYINKRGQETGRIIKTKPLTESTINNIQTALDVAGLEPTVGTLADGTNSVISLLRAAMSKTGDDRKKHIINSGISALSMIPFADVLKILKLRKSKNALKVAKGVKGQARNLKTQKRY